MSQSVYCWVIDSVWPTTTESESLEYRDIKYFSQSGKNKQNAEPWNYDKQLQSQSVNQWNIKSVR